MCAIAGAVGLPMQPQTRQKMLKSMQRRGPDGKGEYVGQGITLLHTRLAIIDPEGGAQPMSMEWAGEQYTLVYNGELYNAEELREQLQNLGHCFLGHSDTEVVLHAYAQWGRDCLIRFNGIFGLAVWEHKRHRLFLGRDRIGVKPLFYKLHEDGLIFASEIKTILAYPSVKAELDAQGAAQVILLGPGRIPGCGVFRNILELEPGCAGFYEDGRFRPVRYWKLRDREHTHSLDETLERVRFLVTDSIRRQMVSDVPVGCFLSGGLDSSIISAICAGEKERIDTFSVDYQDNDRYFVAGKFQPNSDGEYIRLMSETINSHHHWSVLTSNQLVSSLEEATIARDLPGMADVDFSLLVFCGDIRQEVKVALSGECADEIFGGYPWFRDPEVRNHNGFPWAQNTLDRVSLLNPSVHNHAEEMVQDQYQTTIHQCDILPNASPLERRMKEMVNLNFRWFMQTLLDRKDRMSMYHGLEVRVPFCDHRIAEYLYSVPWEMKDLWGREKGLLRKAMEGLLPEQVLYRKKSPYPKTHHPEYEALIYGRLKALMDCADAPIWQLLSRQAVADYLEKTMHWPWYGQLMGRPQTMAYFLQINFWLENYKIQLNW